MSIVLYNCRLCIGGRLVEGRRLAFSDAGLIEDPNISTVKDEINLQGAIVAPGFLEVQTNGLRGFHFTHFRDASSYTASLDRVARYLPSEGVTGFYPTIPTVSSEEFRKILPFLKPRNIADGASVLGAHCEGPYLHPSKKGAHNAALFQAPSMPPEEVYGSIAKSSEAVKIVTLAPELEGAPALIEDLVRKGIRVSLGHSSATFEQGIAGVQAGATLLTHTLNAMPPLHHRDPGLAGLVALAPSRATTSPYFSVIPDGNHLHPSIVTLLFRSGPGKCIFTTDSIELAGLPDGTYPGHAQIPHNQTKQGSRVVIEGTDTLIGGCASLQECVQNVIRWSGCQPAEAIRCVTENVADFTGDKTRGKLEVGRRADFVILDDNASVLETYISGRRVFSKQ